MTVWIGIVVCRVPHQSQSPVGLVEHSTAHGRGGKEDEEEDGMHNDQELAERADDASLGFGITAPPSHTRDRKVTVDSVLFSCGNDRMPSFCRWCGGARCSLNCHGRPLMLQKFNWVKKAGSGLSIFPPTTVARKPEELEVLWIVVQRHRRARRSQTGQSDVPQGQVSEGALQKTLKKHVKISKNL